MLTTIYFVLYFVPKCFKLMWVVECEGTCTNVFINIATIFSISLNSEKAKSVPNWKGWIGNLLSSTRCLLRFPEVNTWWFQYSKYVTGNYQSETTLNLLSAEQLKLNDKKTLGRIHHISLLDNKTKQNKKY